MKNTTTLLPVLGLFSLGVLFTAGVIPSGAKSVGTGASFKGPVGLQLYSLRADFSKDVLGTLARVRDYGIRYVELAGNYNYSPAEFKKQLDAHGLKPVAAHFPFERYRDDVQSVAAEAKALGLEYTGLAWIPHEGTFTEKACREAAAIFNRAGEVLAKKGFKFFYHQHGYEFQPYGQGTLMDLLVEETRPQFVSFELDVFWAVYPGQDPVTLLQKHGSRWALMHLKDLKKGVKTGDLSGHADVTYDVTLGTGQMDMPAILKAAQAAGVKYYFIEDESPTAAAQIPKSLRFLEQVQF